MRRYGGLREVMPITFVTFGLGYLAIIGIPPFSGFFTKDPIIEAAFDRARAARLGARHLRADRRRAHRVLHDPADVHDLLRRSGAGTEDAHPHESPPVMTIADDPARGRLGRRGRVPHHQRPAAATASPRWSGCRRASHGFCHASPGVVALVLGPGRRGPGLGHVRRGSRSPRTPRAGGSLTVAARKDLYGDAFNESVFDAARPVADPGSRSSSTTGASTAWSTALAARGRRDVGPAAAAADRLRPLVRPVHVRRRRCAGRLAPGGEALMNGFPWLTVAGAVPLLGALVIALIPGLPADSAEADRQARNAHGQAAGPRVLPADARRGDRHRGQVPGRRAELPVHRDLLVDPGVRRALRARRGRHRAGADRHVRGAGAGGDPGLLERRREPGRHSVQDLLRADAGARDDDDRRLRGHRRVPVLRVLRGHAGPDVLPDRQLRRPRSGSTRR